MHISMINGPMRTAALGARMSSATLAPFSYSTTISASPLPSFQNRAASTGSRYHGVIPFNKQQPALLKSRPQQQAQQNFLTTVLRNTSIRANSTSTTSTSKASASPQAGDNYLDWNSFFKLRASRRRYSLASSILSSIATTAIGVQILSTQDLENLGAQVMGLDPFVVLGMATAACGAIGWLVGPFLGNAVWGLVYRRYKPAVQVKEKEFYDRIKRFRVDPSSNSMTNPVPDYYGEKIGSVQGYRQWLKDQRAYNRKRRSFIL
ncbi:hypothetical protein VTN00DRAFT_3245 [Thermoascus crustaceus]|uniref:uncharacterized protein n=1 Tax=Thermoascus crustaceus TaxID=5088 RepID=UPI003742064D